MARSILELRVQVGLSQKDLAALAGTSPATISRVEAGECEGVSLATLRRIASALGARIEVRMAATTGARRG